MKLEIDLLRDLLIYVEENAREPWSDLTEIYLDGWTGKEVTYHVMLAREANLINAWSYENPDCTDQTKLLVTFSIQRLTFNGHELLGAVRDCKHWQHIRADLESAGITNVGAVRAHIEAHAKTEIYKRFGLDIS